ELWLLSRDELFECRNEGVGSIGLEFRVLDRIDLREFLASDFGGECCDASTDDGGFERPASFGGDGLAGGKGLPRDAVQLSFTLLNNHQNCIGHKDRSQVSSQFSVLSSQFSVLSSQFSVLSRTFPRAEWLRFSGARAVPFTTPDLRENASDTYSSGLPRNI